MFLKPRSENDNHKNLGSETGSDVSVVREMDQSPSTPEPEYSHITTVNLFLPIESPSMGCLYSLSTFWDSHSQNASLKATPSTVAILTMGWVTAEYRTVAVNVEVFRSTSFGEEISHTISYISTSYEDAPQSLGQGFTLSNVHLETPTFVPTPLGTTDCHGSKPYQPVHPAPPAPPHTELIALGVIILFLLSLGSFLIYRRRRRKASQPTSMTIKIDVPSPLDPISSRQFGNGVQGSLLSNRRLLSLHNLNPKPLPEPILDDQALFKTFNDLDGKITDHVFNYWHNGEIGSTAYQDYMNKANKRASWDNIIYQPRPLLANVGARVQIFRATLAYHVYTCIADWRVFTAEQQAQVITTGDSLRRKICHGLHRSEPASRERVDIVYNILERETRLHVSNEYRYNELHQQSLVKLAESVVLLAIQLGSQNDSFRFDFRNKDASGSLGSDPLAVKLLGESVSNNDSIEISNYMDGTVRALISPGVIRVPSSKRKEPYIIKRSLVYTA
ncbi:hypothetical protein TWF281_003325 [Arthrobotrys megalospora]